MKPIAVFVGIPSCGKTTIGKMVAERLGVEFRDVDLEIQDQCGMTTAEIFSVYGETYFRNLEQECVAKLLESFTGVVSLGGGAVVNPQTQSLLRNHNVVYVKVDLDVALERVLRHPEKRPLLVENPQENLKRLARERDPIYTRLAKITVQSSNETPSSVVNSVLERIKWLPLQTAANRSKTRVITINGSPSYNIYVGDINVADYLLEEIAGQGQKVLLAYVSELEKAAKDIARHLESANKNVFEFVCKSGEDCKTLSEIERLWDTLGNNNFGRDDTLVAIGGGSVTDMAGFAAATWIRGISYINIPTTLLSMVDAAVGGKTGINSKFGKNLIGSFAPPKAVICYLGYINTLPKLQLISGMAEVIKCGFISDHKIIEIVENSTDFLDPHSRILFELIYRAITVKANVVGQDLRESGIREILNYGHTFGHAVEKYSNYSLLHGQAVSLGCIFAAHIAYQRGILSFTDFKLHENILRKIGLPVRLPGDFCNPTSNYVWKKLLNIMALDKKVRSSKLRFVVIDGINNPIRITDPLEKEILSAYDYLLQTN